LVLYEPDQPGGAGTMERSVEIQPTPKAPCTWSDPSAARAAKAGQVPPGAESSSAKTPEALVTAQ
jgi:hypothetical protein